MISFVPGYYGHLGNQLFQYAATRALAEHNGVECGWPSGKQPDLYSLFPLTATRRIIPGPLYQEPHFHYAGYESESIFWQVRDGATLSGYFQSWRYFETIGHIIRREFAAPAVADVDAVSIHVRRGDYLTFSDHHPPCEVRYYAEAMERFPGARFMVFSNPPDGPGWALLNIKPLAKDVEIVVGNPAHEDMDLMARCQHNIIANSSFSWWSAWLNPNPEKRVIAPAKWFGPAKSSWDTRDLYCDKWEVL